MLVSNNDEEPEAALVEVTRPPDTKLAVGAQCVHGLALSPKHPLAHEMVAMLRLQSLPEQSGASSNEDEAASAFEDDDLPMLESNRPSCTTPQEPVMVAASAQDEAVDRLSDSVPEGELHVWVYEARQISSVADAVYDQHGISVRCTLLGAVQQSACNISGTKSSPVWRQTRDGARDGMQGHFAWALGQPEDTVGDATGVGVEASECKLEIDVVCGERVVGSASVALEDLLLSSKARAFEENDVSGTKVIRLCPHWLPFAGNDAGLLQLSLEFVPVPPHQQMAERTRQRKARFEPRDLVEACRALPWLDQRDDIPQQEEEDGDDSTKVIVSRSGGVTIPPLAPKTSTTSFGLRPGGEQEQLMDKQLWDLYYFGISDEAPEAGKRQNLTSRSGASIFSRQASTCASDVLAYNELIQDMESAMKSMKETTPPPSIASNQEGGGSEGQSKTENENVKSPVSSPTPKLHLRLRRLSRPTLNLRQPLDRLQSFWHDAKARASSSSNASNESSSPKDRSPGRKSDSSPSNSRTSPLNENAVQQQPGHGVALFRRARSESLHSLTDLYLPKTGDMHSMQVTAPATSTAESTSSQGQTPNRSNVVYINGAPLCVGKFIDVGNVPGIELCEQKGKNSGTVDGEKYFSCPPNHGIFIRASRLDLSLH
uniref:CAP-Gly domain-containing protein n=1 Tax=Phytophthora ramorum TaxID=164328 RepID=H3HCI1_PHYRM